MSRRAVEDGSRDLYDVLGVASSATHEEIRSAFRRLAREHHPDANPNDAAAETRFKRINAAFRVLGDPDKRRAYNDLTPQVDDGDAWQEVFPGELIRDRTPRRKKKIQARAKRKPETKREPEWWKRGPQDAEPPPPIAKKKGSRTAIAALTSFAIFIVVKIFSVPTPHQPTQAPKAVATEFVEAIPTVIPSRQMASYSVVAGDGWFAIARRNRVDVNALLAANNATIDQPIHPGDRLNVPSQ